LRESWGFKLAGFVTVAVVGLFTVVPLGFVVLNSFNVAAPGKPFQLGLAGWQEGFSDPKTARAIGYTFLLSTRSFVGVGIAFLLSWLLVRARIPGRAFIEFSLWLGFFLPHLPLTLGWILLLDPNYGLINRALMQLPFVTQAPFSIYSVGGILWIHLTLTMVPVMTILLMPALRQFDAAIEESARACGSSAWTTLRRITIPILSPTILTVTIAGLIRSLEAFEIEQLIGTPAGIDVYATRIFDLISWSPAQFSPAMALSTFFLGVLFVLALFYQRFTATREFGTVTGKGMSLRPVSIGRWRYLASALCVALAAVGIFLPLATLLTGSFMRLYGFFHVASPFTTAHWRTALGDPLFLSSLGNSLILGLTAALLGVGLYSLIGYAIQRSRLPGRHLVSIFAWLPWAVPGILLGVALLWLLLSLPGVSLFYGTFVPLILVLIIKEMPIGTHLMKSAFGQIARDLEDASQASGAGWLTTFRRITLPLVAPTLVSLFILVFIGALKDISTTILLVTAATRPLSILMMEFSRGGQLEVASILGVVISVAAIAAALIGRRLGLRLGTQG
jgi:iron(III) transport system permease protein